VSCSEWPTGDGAQLWEKLVEGTPEEVMANPKVKEAYFGSEDVEEVMTYA